MYRLCISASNISKLLMIRMVFKIPKIVLILWISVSWLIRVSISCLMIFPLPFKLKPNFSFNFDSLFNYLTRLLMKAQTMMRKWLSLVLVMAWKRVLIPSPNYSTSSSSREGLIYWLNNFFKENGFREALKREDVVYWISSRMKIILIKV